MRAYIFGIARNLVLRRFRTSEREAEEAADATAPVDVLGDLLEAERSELVAGAMAKLPLLQREAIILFTFEELSLDEIAKITGVDAGTVKSRLHRARESLRTALAPLLTLLREWKSPKPPEELDRRVTSAYRSAVRPPRFSLRVWRRFWTMRVSLPAPALVVAALAIFALFFWLRPSAAPVASPVTSGVVTRPERQWISTVTEWRGTGSPGHGGSEMKGSAYALVSLTALASVLHADSQHILRASFPDGTGLEIFTQTTGSSQIDTEGGMGIGPGVEYQDLVNRVVVDRANNILFVYNLEASRGASPGTVKIRIEPISAATEAEMLKDAAAPGRPRFSGTHLPTVAGVREFPAVKIGEVVTLDILYNPSNGEKIYDVLRPITSSSPGMSVTAVVAPETISLRQVGIRVNGRALSAPASWMIGVAVRIDIPGHGTYVVAAYDPREASPERGFAAIAQADGKTLSWAMGRDRVEITSSTNVLTRSDKGSLWVYHDPHYQPDVVGLQSADTVDWLLPKR